MDQNRQIRFLIPPFFLFASLFWADFLSCSNIIARIAAQPNINILAIVAALGASTIPIGFLLGAIPIGVFNAVGCVCKNWNYESSISLRAFKQIWPQLETKLKFDLQKRFYASVTFDHDILPKGINKWIMRRWNAFNININCFTALLLSHIVRPLFSIETTCYCVLTTVLIMALLLFNAIMAWCQTMKMIEFQATRKLNKKEGERE